MLQNSGLVFECYGIKNFTLSLFSNIISIGIITKKERDEEEKYCYSNGVQSIFCSCS
jgi:hypothetical protein